MKKFILSLLNINPEFLHAYSTALLQGKAYRVLNNSLTNILDKRHISIPAWKLLGQLHDKKLLSSTKLAELLDVEMPMITRLVKELTLKKLVLTVPNTVDGRSKLVSITQKGSLFIEELEQPVKSMMKLLLKGVSYKDLVTYLHVLETIVDNNNDMPKDIINLSGEKR
jgi:DNA-binding MarR family transcriptional regulator